MMELFYGFVHQNVKKMKKFLSFISKDIGTQSDHAHVHEGES